MVSIKAAARASLLVSLMIATVLAEPGGSKLREDPLSALDNQDLAELLEMDLDEVFLVPKTMLDGGGSGSADNTNRHHHHHHRNNRVKRQIRHLQEDPQEGGSPSPSLAETTGAPTDGATDRGISFSPSPSSSSSSLAETTGAPTDASDRGLPSSFFSSSYSSPSAAPTAAPTATDDDAGSGSRGGLFGTGAPTAAPSSFADRGFDIDEDNNNNNNNDAVDREVAAAQKVLLSGGSAGVVAAVVATTTLAMAVAGVLS